MNLQGLRKWVRAYVPFLAFTLIALTFIIVAPTRFLSRWNLVTILSQSAVTSVMAFGMTFVIVAGSIDLSVGSVAALAAMLSAVTIGQFGLIPGLLVGLLIGAMAGLFNGLVSTHLRIPSFIVTLGMLIVARALTIIYARGSAVMIRNDAALMLGRFPNIYYMVLTAFIISSIVYRYTRMGRYTQAIGGDERVAVLTGVPVPRIKVQVFTLCGLLASLGGMMLAFRCGAATTTMAMGLELDVICATAVGGTPLTGGTGKVYGGILGAIIVAMLGNGLIILGASSEMQQVIKGLVLIAAVAISLEREKIGIIK